MSNNLLLIPEKDFTYCAVFKAGSSAWLEKVVKLSGKSPSPRFTHEQVLQKAKSVTKKGSFTSTLNQVMTSPKKTALIIVRHPFEKIVAAFRDKLERTHGNNSFYQRKYGVKIVTKYRGVAKRRFGREIFDSQHNFGAPLPVIPKELRLEKDLGMLPIFWEFVQYLLSTSPAYYDEHWRPTHRHCCLCTQGTVEYNYVIKLEHLKDEERAFLDLKGWRDLVKSNSWDEDHGKDFRNANYRHNLTSAQVTELYFKNISDADVQRLYNIYKADFQLFGYQFKRGNMVLG